MYSSCVAASKFVLRKINSGVWFVQTFLRKILYIAKPPNFPYASSAVNMWIMNQFHTHSQKKQNPTKKFIKSGQIEIVRGGEGEIARWRRDRATRSSDAVLRSTSGEVLRSMIGVVRSSDWSSVCGRQRSLFFLSLCDVGSLSLSLSRNTLK